MIREARRSKRYDRFLPIGFMAMDTQENGILPGPVPGRIINISCHGAGLLMSQVMFNSFRLFHSIQENDNSCIPLTINVQPEIRSCKISGQPVWMDNFPEGDIRAFKMGIEFMEDAGCRQ